MVYISCPQKSAESYIIVLYTVNPLSKMSISEVARAVATSYKNAMTTIAHYNNSLHTESYIHSVIFACIVNPRRMCRMVIVYLCVCGCLSVSVIYIPL